MRNQRGRPHRGTKEKAFARREEQWLAGTEPRAWPARLEKGLRISSLYPRCARRLGDAANQGSQPRNRSGDNRNFLGEDPAHGSAACIGPGVCKNNVPPARRTSWGTRQGGRRHTNTFLPAQFNVVSPDRVAGGAPHRKERLFCNTPKPPDRHVAYYNIETRGAHIGKVCIAAAGGRRLLRRRRNVIFANTGLGPCIGSGVCPPPFCYAAAFPSTHDTISSPLATKLRSSLGRKGCRALRHHVSKHGHCARSASQRPAFRNATSRPASLLPLAL